MRINIFVVKTNCNKRCQKTSIIIKDFHALYFHPTQNSKKLILKAISLLLYNKLQMSHQSPTVILFDFVNKILQSDDCESRPSKCDPSVISHTPQGSRLVPFLYLPYNSPNLTLSYIYNETNIFVTILFITSCLGDIIYT